MRNLRSTKKNQIRYCIQPWWQNSQLARNHADLSTRRSLVMHIIPSRDIDRWQSVFYRLWRILFPHFKRERRKKWFSQTAKQRSEIRKDDHRIHKESVMDRVGLCHAFEIVRWKESLSRLEMDAGNGSVGRGRVSESDRGWEGTRRSRRKEMESQGEKVKVWEPKKII